MLREAIRRYSDVFLPLLAHLTEQKAVPELAVPLDIAWLWHCHKLAPLQYAKDCEVKRHTTLSRQLRRRLAARPR